MLTRSSSGEECSYCHLAGGIHFHESTPLEHRYHSLRCWEATNHQAFARLFCLAYCVLKHKSSKTSAHPYGQNHQNMQLQYSGILGRLQDVEANRFLVN